MDFGAVTAKKFSNGYGVSGKSAYDGVFASPIKFRAPSFSSSFGDYCEIFAGSEASLGSSIPILEVPELNERKILHDSRRSKLDYSKVFGGFGNLDTAVPYEELFAEHKKKDSFSKGALSLDKGANHSSKEDSTNSSKEIPPVGQEASLNGANKVNMSYHKVNQGSESRQKGATHIAQLHAVPAYTCLVEEVNPLKINSADKQQSSNGGVKIKDSEHSMKSVIDPSPNSAKQQSSNGGVKIKDSEHSMKSVINPSPNSAKQQSSNGGVKFHDRSDSVHMFLNAREVNHGSDSGMKQSSNDGVKVQDSSDSINMFSDACEVSHESQGTDYIEVPTSQTVVNDLDNHHGHAVRSMEDTCQVSKSDASEVVDGADSPLYFDDMVDSNSEAAASVAALRKAIEEAQERLRIAKDLMKRKKEGFPDRMKRRFNNDSKAERKKDKFADKTMRHEETFGKMDVLPQMPSVIGKPTMKEEQVTLDLKAEEMVDAKEAARKALKKLESTIAERQDEVEHKEVDHKETVLGFNDAYNNKEILYTVEDYHLNEKNTGKNAFEKPEESHQTIIVEGPREPEAKEGKVNAGDEAGGCEKLVDEKKFRCQEHVEDTKLAQETLDYGEKDKNLKEDDDEITDNKDAPFLEQKDCERKLGEHGLPAGIEEYFNCKPDDEKKVEGSCEQEDCTRSSRDHQGYVELKEKVTEEQTESEENEASFLDLNQEIEYCCQRESSENGFGNIYVQEIPEDNVDNVDEEEEFHEILTKESADGNERVQYAKEDEMELEGATCMMEENEKRNSESIEVIGVILNGPNYEVEKTEEVERTTEICPNSEPDEGGNLSKLLVADESFVSNKIPEVTSEGFSHNEQDDTMVANNASFQCEEKFDESESVQEMNEPGEKHALETSALTQGALELNEVMNQMQYTNETVSIDSIPTNIGEPDEKAEQSQDDCLKEAENNCNPAMHVEEPSPDFVNLCEDTKEAEDALNAEIDKNRCNFSNEEILVENERNMEASQPPSMSEWESSAVNYQEIKRIHSNLNEAEDGLNAEIDENRCKSSYEEIIVDNEPNLEASQPPSMSERKSNTFSNQEIKRTLSNTKKNHHVASLTMEEKKANDTSQKVELETDHLKKIDETKDRGREREKEKEKIAVERAIREARERAFAEARERAALERASAEARRKNISDGRERLGRTTGQANEKTLTERAAMEAKLKAERAAVERATAEARARALERALSEKAASEARNKSDKSFAEKSFGASKDNGTRPNFHSKSFSYGDTFDGANGDSAQRCKARFERHQRIGERVAKALAEKNARDRLVQKEQEEKNRVAEALDADVKRWSSGKEGNLRALLSTLQYILGPDSGWQPIHLTDIVNAAAVKKAYRKATLFVHPDKLQQRGASIQQKYTCEKVFDLLKEAWNRFNMEER